MRRLCVALAACTLVAAPVGLLAQQVAPPIAKPAPPGQPGMPARPPGHGGTPGKPGHPQPRPSGYNPNRYNNYTPYVYIDAAPYLATPTPKPKPKQTPAAHHTNNGQEVFSTHSTNDAK